MFLNFVLYLFRVQKRYEILPSNFCKLKVTRETYFIPLFRCFKGNFGYQVHVWVHRIDFCISLFTPPIMKIMIHNWSDNLTIALTGYNLFSTGLKLFEMAQSLERSGCFTGGSSPISSSMEVGFDSVYLAICDLTCNVNDVVKGSQSVCRKLSTSNNGLMNE